MPTTSLESTMNDQTAEYHSRLLATDIGYKLAGLVSARLQAERRRRPKLHLRFKLASNVAEINPISEIVLNLKWFEDGKFRRVKYFIHIKQDSSDKQTTVHDLSSETSNISIVKCFKQFKYLREKIQESPTEARKRNRNPHKYINDFRFILFTNGDVYRSRFSSKASSSLLFPFEEVFDTGTGDVFSYGERDEDIWYMIDGEDKAIFRKEYLPRLRIFSGQANSSNIAALLAKAAIDAIGSHVPREQNIIKNLTTELRLWWQRADSYPLSEDSLEIHEVLRDDIMKTGDQRRFEFNTENCTNLAGILSRHKTIYVSVPGVVCQLRCSKLRQILEENIGEYSFNPERYMILSESSFYEYPHSVLQTLCTELCDTLIVDIDNYSSIILSFILGIIDHVDKLVVVSSTYIPKVRKFLQKHGHMYQEYRDEWTIMHLSGTLQEQLLRRRVLFQGQETVLGDLEIAWPSLRKIMGGAYVQALANGEVETIGAPLPPSDDEYVPRKLQHRSELRGDVFNHSSEDDYFLLSNFPETILTRLRSPQTFWQEQHIMEVNNTEERPSALETSSPSAEEQTAMRKTKWSVWDKKLPPGKLAEKVRKNVHWIAYEGSTIIWKHTYGDEQVLGKYVDRQCLNCQNNFICSHYDVDDFLNWNNPTVLLSGDIGIGKSVFMKRMANKIKDEKKTHWVVLLKINQGEVLNSLPTHIKLGDVIDLLANSVQYKTSHEIKAIKYFLKDCLENSGCIAVLVDVVAEICSIHLEKVKRILTLLQESRAQFLCVAATTSSEIALRSVLKCSPSTLQSFSENDQFRYLVSRWSQGLKDDERIQMEDKVRRLVERIQDITDYEGRRLCDVPLYTRMLVVAYNGVDRHILLKHCLAEVELKMSLLTLYRKYVQEARKSVRLKKENTTKLAVLSVQENFINKLKSYAAFLCFHDRKFLCGQYSNCARAMRDLNKFEIDLTSGLVTKESNSRLRFVHHTFKEYFAALWCLDHYQSLQEVMKALYTERFKRIRFFFDALLAEGHSLHEAAIRGNPEIVNMEMHHGHTADSGDRGGRTPIHLAASYGHAEVTGLLVNSGANITCRDSVKGWTPLRYADNGLHLGAAEQLLRGGADRKDLRRIPEEFTAGKITYTEIVTGDMVRILEILTHPESQCHTCKLCPRRVTEVPAEMWEEAALAGSINVAEILMNSGVDIHRSTHCEMTVLHIAAFSGNDSFTRLLLQHGSNINATDSGGETALHKAVRRGHMYICEELLKFDANVNAQDSLGRTPLFHSVVDPQKKSLCELLVGYNADINVQTSQGTTVLLAAARFGNMEACQLLLKYGAKVHVSDKNGRIPLHVAVESGNEVICSLLLRHDAEVNARDAKGQTALHYAAFCGQESVRICRLLLEFGADLNISDSSGSTPLHSAVKCGNQWMSRTLFRYKPDVNACNVMKRTVLHEAILASSDDVKLILDLGANVNIQDIQGYSAIHFAVVKLNDDLCRILISRGADVRHKSVSDGPPLHTAAKSGHLWISRLLIESGADINCTDAKQRTALHYAAKGNHEAVSCLLLQQGADPNIRDVLGRSVLATASREGRETVCRMLLEYGADVNSRDIQRQTSLHLSARHGHEGVCHLLLMYQANVNDRDVSGHSPLQLAAVFKHKAVCNLLLTHGANSRLKDYDEISALLAAAFLGHEDICRLLIDNGADINVSESHGITALHAASKSGHENVCRLLLDQKLDINAEDSSLLSALDYASNKEIYSLLQRRGAKPGRFVETTATKARDNVFNKYFPWCFQLLRENK